MVKSWKSVDEQLTLLKRRNLSIQDDETARLWLKTKGYYRLSGYSYPFRKPLKEPLYNNRQYSALAKRGDDFLNNVSFEDIKAIYEFDAILRKHLFTALKQLELRLRVAIGHKLGEYDTFAHLNQDFWKDENLHKEHRLWLQIYTKKLFNCNSPDFVKHHIYNRQEEPPIWAALELWDFGMMQNCFKNLKREYANEVLTFINLKPNIITQQIFTNWLRSFNIMRNLCAHHSRIWNHSFPEGKALTSFSRVDYLKVQANIAINSNKLFYYLHILAYLFYVIDNDIGFVKNTKDILLKFPHHSTNAISLNDMGVPKNWERIELWK